MADPSYKSVGSLLTQTSGTTITPVIPTWVAGNLAVVIINVSLASRVFTAPAGWTKLGIDTNTTNLSQCVLFRILETGDANPTVTVNTAFSTTAAGYGRVYLFEGDIDPEWPIGHVLQTNEETENAIPRTSPVIALFAGALVVSLFGNNNDNVFSSGMPPSGWSQNGTLANNNAPTADGTIHSIRLPMSSPGVAAAVNWGTLDASDTIWRTTTFVINPIHDPPPYPWLVASNRAAGTGAVTPPLPRGTQTGDLLIMHIEGEGEDASADQMATPADWPLTPPYSIASATGGVADNTRCTVWACIYDAADPPNLATADAGDHTIVALSAWRGVDPSEPFDTTAVLSSTGTNATSFTATGITSVTDLATIVCVAGHGDDLLTISAEDIANGDFSALGYDYGNPAGSDGTTLCIWGPMAAAGASGDVTWTVNASEEMAAVVLALRPFTPPTPFVEASAAAAVTASRSPSVTFSGYTPVEGDVVYLFTSALGNGNLTGGAEPAGWVNPLGTGVVTEPSDSSMSTVSVYHVVTSGEASGVVTTYTATNLWSGAQDGEVLGVVVRHASGSVSVDDASGLSEAGNADPHILPGLTGANLSTGSLVISGVAADETAATLYTTPVGWESAVAPSGTNQAAWLGARDGGTVEGVSISATSIDVSLASEFGAITVAFGPAGAPPTWDGSFVRLASAAKARVRMADGEAASVRLADGSRL